MRTAIRQLFASVLTILITGFSAGYSAWAPAEHTAQISAKQTREVFSASSPRWLEAVGKLQVPGVKYENGRQRNHREDCSATLVSTSGSKQANTIVTAWHCLEFYKDLSKTILFTLRNGTGHTFSSEARVLVHGGGMHADWAILRLKTPVPGTKIAALELSNTDIDSVRSITMAGYSNDGKNSGFGQKLSYHYRCNVLPVMASSNRASDCIAMKGASGGAVAQLSEDGRIKLGGVISRGNGWDFSEYVPVQVFRLAAQPYL